MSRTYRAAKLPIDCKCGAPIGWRWVWALTHKFPAQEETDRERNKALREGVAPHRCCRCWTNRKHDYYSKRNHKRDNKPKENSRLTDKKMYGRKRKAKIKDAMRHERYENIPMYRTSNDDDRHWDYY